MISFRSRPRADNQCDFISPISFFNFFLPPLLSSALLCAQAVDGRLSALGRCQLFLVMPPPPLLSSSPSPHLFCLGQFGPGGASLQNKSLQHSGKASSSDHVAGIGRTVCSPGHLIIIALGACAAACNDRSRI